MKKLSNKAIAITVALIGLAGAIAAPIIGEWFGPKSGEINSATNTGTNYGFIVGKVEFPPASQRHLNQATIDLLNQNLPSDKKIRVGILSVSGNVEAQNFAQEIGQYIIDKGWNYSGFIGSFMSNNSAGIHWEYNDVGHFIIEVGEARNQ